MESIKRTRINGKMMSQYIGKKVVVAGRLTKVNSSGDCAEITTFDDVVINATLSEPLECHAEGILEVWGTVKSRGTVEADHRIHFDEENSKNFDGKTYREYLVIQNAARDRRWKLDSTMNAL